MVYRLLFFLLLLTACSSEKSGEAATRILVSSRHVTIIQEPAPTDHDPSICREINTITDRFFAGSAGAMVATFLARTRVQCEVDTTARFDQLYLKVKPAPGVMVSNDTLMEQLLTAIDARLLDLEPPSHYLLLRSDAIREDIILGSSDYTGELSESASLDSLAVHGIQVENNTGVALTMDQETLDFYLPSMHDFFGDSLGKIPFWLEAVPVKRVRLVAR